MTRIKTSPDVLAKALGEALTDFTDEDCLRLSIRANNSIQRPHDLLKHDIIIDDKGRLIAGIEAAWRAVEMEQDVYLKAFER